MPIVRIETDATEVILSTMTKLAILQTGLIDVLLKIYRTSDNYIYDFNDNTFKVSGWTSIVQTMSEIDSTNLPGQYRYTFDTSAIVNSTVDDTYMCIVTCASADNVPQLGEIKVGDYIDTIGVLQAGVKEVLGLVQSNFRIRDTVYDAKNNLISAVIRTYNSKADTEADTNHLHEYVMSSTVDADNNVNTYLSTKE